MSSNKDDRWQSLLKSLNLSESLSEEERTSILNLCIKYSGNFHKSEESYPLQSTSPFNSPMILVQNKLNSEGERAYRLCVDFRKLNENLISTQYPLPRITEILEQLGNSVYFSTLDLSQGFHQVLIEKKDREKLRLALLMAITIIKDAHLD